MHAKTSRPNVPFSPPVDAAAAFANPVPAMVHDDPRAASHETNRRQARCAVGSYVADVLALFDERARAYLPGAPTVLRFEGCDLAVFVMRGPHIALHVGSWKPTRP